METDNYYFAKVLCLSILVVFFTFCKHEENEWDYLVLSQRWPSATCNYIRVSFYVLALAY